MNLLARFRTRGTRLASVSTGLFVLFWLALVAAPCAMAMMVPGSGHDCPHCPPEPCHEVQAEQCDELHSLDLPRAGEKVELPVVLLPVQPPVVDVQPARSAEPHSHAPIRAGPRPHLVFQRFNE